MLDRCSEGSDNAKHCIYNCLFILLGVQEKRTKQLLSQRGKRKSNASSQKEAEDNLTPPLTMVTIDRFLASTHDIIHNTPERNIFTKSPGEYSIYFHLLMSRNDHFTLVGFVRLVSNLLKFTYSCSQAVKSGKITTVKEV